MHLASGVMDARSQFGELAQDGFGIERDALGIEPVRQAGGGPDAASHGATQKAISRPRASMVRRTPRK